MNPLRRKTILAGASVLMAGAARAAPARRIGYLLLVPLADPPSRERQAFLDGLRDLGHVEGRNLDITYRSAGGEPEFLASACEELVSRNVELIVASGPSATLAAKRATETLPIVMQAVGDPLGIGAVRSLARPDGNVTGVSFSSTELAGKRVQLIVELARGARRIALLFDPHNPNARAESDAAREAARRLGLVTGDVAPGPTGSLPRALERMAANRPDALYVAFEEGIVVNNRSAIAEFGLRMRVPVVSGWSSLTEAGALLSYAPDLAAIFRRSAYHVHRILEGAKPGDLPIELADKVELVVNARTARALGLAIPQGVAVRADRVID